MRLGDCPSNVVLDNESINDNQSRISNNTITVQDVDIMGDGHLTLIAPEVIINQDAEVLADGRLTIINENRCAH